VGDIETTILKDRSKLSEDGIIIAVIPVSMEAHTFLQPELYSRGFLNPKNADDLLNGARDVAFRCVREYQRDKAIGWDSLKASVRRELKGYFFKETARFPMIVPIVIEV
jgi:ribonuclease J